MRCGRTARAMRSSNTAPAMAIPLCAFARNAHTTTHDTAVHFRSRFISDLDGIMPHGKLLHESAVAQLAFEEGVEDRREDHAADAERGLADDDREQNHPRLRIRFAAHDA